MSKILKNLFKAEKWDAFARIFIFVYIAECTFGSSGRWFEIGPLSIRMILFALCFAATIPAVIRNIKNLAKNWQVIITVCFGIYFLICAVLGFLWGNNRGFIWGDITTLMSLALVPGFLSVMNNKKAIHDAVNVVFYTATILGGATVLLHLVLAFVEIPTIIEVNNLINRASLGGMAVMQTGMQRLYMKSQIFIQVAIVYGVWKIGKSETGKKKILLCICEGILLCACILSYTRGFWLGLLASALIILLTGIKQWKHYLKIVTSMVTILVVFLASSWIIYQSPAAAVEIVNRFDPDLIVIANINGDMEFPVTDEDSEVDKNNIEAVNQRIVKMAEFKKRIPENLIFGGGLGAYLEGVCKGSKTEYIYHDMMLKTGIVGTTLFILTFYGYIAIYVYSRLKKKGLKKCCDNDERNRFMVSAYLGVAVTSFFNPFLNNPMGIMLLMLTVAALQNGEPKNSEV